MNILNCEKNIIAAVKIDNNIHDEYKLSSNMFTNSKHKEIYDAITFLIESGEEANDITIMNQLEKRNSSIKQSEIIDFDIISSANVKYYIDIVRENNIGIRLKKLKFLIDDKVKHKNYSECIELIEKEIQQLSMNGHGQEIYVLKDLLNIVLNKIEKRYKSGGKIEGILTGYSGIDKILCGLNNQELIILGGRPSLGKTALILNIILRIIKNKIKCGLFSSEMYKELIAERMIVIDSRINFYSVKTGKLRKKEFEDLFVSFNNLYTDLLLIDDTPNIEIKQLKSNARRMVRKGIKIIFIDYLTLIKGNQDSRFNRAERVGEISKGLKQLARELDIPIIVASQLGREAEGKKPTLANIRQSGEIEEDADVICLLHGKREATEIDFIIAKNRQGATGNVKLYFNRPCLRFEELVVE